MFILRVKTLSEWDRHLLGNATELLAQNGGSKGISTLPLAAGPGIGQQGKLMKTQFRQLWKCSTNDLRTVPVPVHMTTAWKFFTTLLLRQTGNCWNCSCFKAIMCKQTTTVEKMERCSCVGVGKDPGLISVTWNAQTNHLVQSVSGSKAMPRGNFQIVKCLDELVEQYDGRKSGGRETEFQERIQKEWACLKRGRSFRCFGSGLPVHIQGWPAWLGKFKSSLSSTVLKVTSRNPRQAAGAHCHRYGHWRNSIEKIIESAAI